MDENARAQYYIELLYDLAPGKFLRKVDAKSSGLNIILRYLAGQSGEVCAGDLSKAFGVSTARIAVAVKTLCSRGFVETSPAPTDGRKVVVKITQAGLAETKRNAAELEEFFKKLIEEVGESDLKEFFRIFTRINGALEKA